MSSKMGLKIMGRGLLPVLGVGVLLLPAPPVQAAPQHFERHFAVKGRPVVILQNVANGRIEVKSSKNSEVVVVATQASNKIGVVAEQAEERIDVTATILDNSAPANELEANFTLTVPEETELQLKSQTGLVYVEQVMGDMNSAKRGWRYPPEGSLRLYRGTHHRRVAGVHTVRR